MPDFTKRFTGRADAYSRYRPRYPSEILVALKSEVGFDRRKVVADVGSGTGILSELFLEYGNTVYCVEPNGEMRSAAEELLSPRFPQTFKSVDGRAERTGLEASSIDLITVGQALHWFDIDAARSEFSRILRPGGHLCVVYNHRKRGSGVMTAYNRIVKSLRESAPKVPERSNDATMRRLFSGYRTFTFPNSQRLDLEGLLGRLRSASYSPSPDDTTGAEALETSVRRLFARYSKEGTVALLYSTRVSVGGLRSPVSSPSTGG